MTKQLEGKEAFALYLTEIASGVLAIGQQSALLLEALSQRAVLLSDLAGQAEKTVSAASQTTGEAGQHHQAPGPAENCNTSVLAAGNDEITI